MAGKYWRENIGGKILAGKYWRENIDAEQDFRYSTFFSNYETLVTPSLNQNKFSVSNKER